MKQTLKIVGEILAIALSFAMFYFALILGYCLGIPM